MKAEIRPRIELRNRIPLRELVPLEVPLVIFVDPSDVCNFHCKFCPTGDIKLMKKVGRPLKWMDWDLYKKIIDGIAEFDNPIKVLRLYKDGEPLLNPNFAEMVRYAKKKGVAEKIDTTTNASMLSYETSLDIINAGLDRINISIEGINAKQYKDFSDVNMNFANLVNRIRFFYEESRNRCEVFIKIPGDNLTEEDKQKFFMIFGDICDFIYVEHTMNCWNGFELKDMNENEEFGIYGQPIEEVEVCPYIFYSMSINSDGSVSLCFLDWNRKLLIGDVDKQTVEEIWNDNRNLRSYRYCMLRNERKTLSICGNCSQLSHGMPENIDDCKEKLWRYYT